jgi:hypothetical protein
LLEPLKRLKSHIPRNPGQLEVEVKNILKIVFWAALLSPVIIIPAYYLLVTLTHGLVPQIHLPAGG